MTTTPPSSPREVVIGLDVGTTAAKASAYPVGGGEKVSAQREYPLLEPEPGWQVQNPETMVTAALTALDEVVRGAGTSSVVGISVSTAMHGLIGLDANHVPLTSLLTWADARAGDEARHLVATGQARELHRVSGTPVHPMSPLVKLMWFARNEPELCARVRWWVGLKEYVLWRLTETMATELSCASGTGLLDLSTRDWNQAALDLAGVEIERLPPVLPTTSVLGLSRRVAARLGLPEGLPVVVGAGDGPLGNLGTGALDEGVVGLSMGTSGAVRTIVRGPRVHESGALFCYHLADDLWATGGAVSNGGIVMRWALEVFGRDILDRRPDSPDAELVALAERVPVGSEGLLVVPYLLAERAPLWDPEIPGSVFGLRRGHGRAHFVRAAMEGVATQLATVVDILDDVSPVSQVRATGGVFRSPVWGRVIATALGRPVTTMAAADGSGLGAAALGLYALGRESSLHSALRSLSPAALEPGEPVLVNPDEVDKMRRVRAAIPQVVREQQRLLEIFDAR